MKNKKYHIVVYVKVDDSKVLNYQAFMDQSDMGCCYSLHKWIADDKKVIRDITFISNSLIKFESIRNKISKCDTDVDIKKDLEEFNRLYSDLFMMDGINTGYKDKFFNYQVTTKQIMPQTIGFVEKIEPDVFNKNMENLLNMLESKTK